MKLLKIYCFYKKIFLHLYVQVSSSRCLDNLKLFLRATSWKVFFLLFCQMHCKPSMKPKVYDLLTTSTFWSRGWYPVGFSIYQYKTEVVSLWLFKEILNVNLRHSGSYVEENVLFHRSGQILNGSASMQLLKLFLWDFAKENTYHLKSVTVLILFWKKNRLLHRGWQTSIQQTLPTVRV